MSQYRIAIFASGNGSNAENIIRHFKGHRHIAVAMVLTNNPNAPVLQRAANMEIPARVFDKPQFLESDEVLGWLRQENVTHLVLAGFLWLIPSYLLDSYPGRIINIHPALLPRHGGKGMFGARVHEAVIASGDSESGITIHLVNSRYDEGKTLFQVSCDIVKTDSAKSIADKVRVLELKHYPAVIEKWIMEGQASTA